MAKIKCVKVRTLFAKNKVRFARAEQLCKNQSSQTQHRPWYWMRKRGVELDSESEFCLEITWRRILSALPNDVYTWRRRPALPCWPPQTTFSSSLSTELTSVTVAYLMQLERRVGDSRWNRCPKSHSVMLMRCPGLTSISHSGPPSMQSATLDEEEEEDEDDDDDDAILDR